MEIIKPEKLKENTHLTTTFRLDKQTNDRLNVIAKVYDVTRTEVLRQLINNQYLEDVKNKKIGGNENGN